MLDTPARLPHGRSIFSRLLCAVILAVALFGCGPPTITLNLLMSLNPRARVELSCHRVIGDPGQVHFGVHNEDQNEFVMDDAPELLLEAVQTTDVITHYIPDSPACNTKGAQARRPDRVHLGVIWTIRSPSKTTRGIEEAV